MSQDSKVFFRIFLGIGLVLILISGPQNPQIQLIASPCRPDKRSASGNASRF